MTEPVFPPELRTASIVTRWSIMHTLTRDTVANHSYYVTLYATMIAKLINWQMGIEKLGGDLSCNFKAYFYLTQAALTHDLDEVFTGDIVTFVKKEIINAEYADSYVQAKMKERMPVIKRMATVPDEYVDDVKLILKAADWLDATFFLANEKRIGNKAAEQYLQFAIDNLKAAWLKLPYRLGYKDNILRLWDKVVLPAIQDHTKVKEGP